MYRYILVWYIRVYINGWVFFKPSVIITIGKTALFEPSASIESYEIKIRQ
jgi:hypothetical protein